MTTEHVDVLIVGAGLSGIGAAAQIGDNLPDKKVVVLEARDTLGGTWDLFRYPGIRSDSDMFTFGFKWHPWPGDRSLADAHLILDYLKTVATEHGVTERIRYRHQVVAAEWSTADRQWTVTAETPEGSKTFTASFLWSCSGYYDYEGGHSPVFPGLEDFEGTFVHPQHWPEDLDYTGKKVVVVGSGATAVTLVPSMAERAEHITMLQRTPSYILSRPGRDPLAVNLGRVMSKVPGFVPLKGLRERASFEAVRWANIMLTIVSYQLARHRPETMKRIVRDGVVKSLTARDGGKGFTPEEAEALADAHFTPPYEPWDQRLCFVPDGDLFKWMREGKASVVTDRIKTFTAKGIELESGETLEADVVISATGLRIKLFGGVQLHVDGEPIEANQSMAYKALMLSGIPNFAYTIGYTNASWTLKADLVCEYVVNLLRHMDEHGHEQVVVRRDPGVGELPFMDLASGYIQRAIEQMPKQGDRAPWQLKQNYLIDKRVLAGRVHDDVVTFS